MVVTTVIEAAIHAFGASCSTEQFGGRTRARPRDVLELEPVEAGRHAA